MPKDKHPQKPESIPYGATDGKKKKASSATGRMVTANKRAKKDSPQKKK